MKIVRFTAENVKRLKAVEIEPSGDVVVIAGRNAQGKSSILDAIWLALGGGAAQKETTRPIRDGEDHASVELDLGDLVVTRTWKDGSTSLRVSNHDGASYNSPQKMLDKLVGGLSFDPLEFAHQAAKDQVTTLLDLVELPFDPDELAARRRGIFDDRTDIGREVKALEGELAGLPEVDPVPEPVDTAEVMAQMEKALLDNRTREGVEDQLATCRASVVELEDRLAQTRLALTTAIADLGSLPDIVDTEPLRETLASAAEVNAVVAQHEKRETVVSKLDLARKHRDAFTAKLEALDAEKATALAEADMPVDGLSFDEDGVLYQGIPFKQASAAEQLRVSMAMAMAANPAIRVVRITDGSLLDSENMAVIAEMAKATDTQVWIERVDDTAGVGIIIEDGEIA
jgi:hypothetical protein